ncbi:hypothetical protein PhCBS80983_g05745 [Powellomyces hirtus]|uniref:HOOK N-terminal domain-containing protein n=1 Tax=Powellomyces hirtus TaxID=109895 RepID=A0A507DSU6_9FUNG|nr:hypothetical protein PhCBS80983_g05745 [Powellomyces hirtus]
MVDTDSLGKAVVQWVNTFDRISKPCRSLEDLDGPAILYDILTEIDPQWFKASRGGDYDDNWVMKFNGLKKLYKLLMGYYQEVLGQNTAGLEIPNLTLIARDADVVETLKLAQLVIALAVQCENNQRYVLKIQALDQTSQHALMLAIETVMGRLASPGASRSAGTIEGDIDGSVEAALLYERAELEKTNQELTATLDALRLDYEKVTVSKDGLEKRMKDMESTLSHLSEAGQVDFILRTEIDNLKATLLKTENRRTELELQVEKNNDTIADLNRKLEDAFRKGEEAERLKDALDEFRHMADKLQKSEAIIDKYKKRFEEVGDLRRQLKVAEEQNSHHAARNAQLEEEFRKIASIKPLVDTLKEQLSTLETKNSSLQVENSTLEFQLTETRTKLERYDLEKRADNEHIQNLEDQLRDMEYQVAESGRPEGSPSEASPGGESLLKVKVNQLEREVERLRADKSSAQAIGEKMVQLENLLEDANRLKAKYEHDYRIAYEKNIALENELSQLQSMAAGDRGAGLGSPQTPTGSHRSLASDLEPLQQQIKKLSEELRQSMGRVNKMSYERDKLQAELSESQNALNQHDRVISELRGDLAAMETRGQSSDESVQKLASITKQAVDAQSQNDYLHTALKQAKEHIRRQENALKDYATMVPKDDNFSEAIASLNSTISEREAELERVKHELEDTRAAARREQKLLASAWYSTVTEAQIKASAKLKINANAAATAAPAATPADAPKSWLHRERQRLDQFGMRR